MAEEEFAAYAPIADDEERPPRRWPLILGLLILVVAAAAAFWFFAPSEWKARAGLAQAGSTPLQLMITTSDRQALQSGNELVAISGRVINPTDREQPVPPIIAELRDKQSKRVVHRWTIPPPARALAPRTSASFNSAEVDVPTGGDELTSTLGAMSPDLLKFQQFCFPSVPAASASSAFRRLPGPPSGKASPKRTPETIRIAGGGLGSCAYRGPNGWGRRSAGGAAEIDAAEAMKRGNRT